MGIPTSLSGAGTPPSEHDYTLMDAMAATTTARQEMGIVANSLDVSFIQLGGNLWQYQASPENPLLPMFSHLSIGYAYPKDDPGPANTEYNRLCSQLPPDLLNQLQANNRNPATMKDDLLNALENLLRYSATLLSVLHNAVKVSQPATEERTAQNKLIASTIIAGVLASSKRMLKAIEADLYNLPVDAGVKADLRHLSDRVLNIVTEFENKREEINQAEGDKSQLIHQLMNELTKDIRQIEVLKDELKDKVPTGIFELIIHNLQQGAVLACTGSAQELMTAANVAMIGNTVDSQTGFIGGAINSLLDGMVSALEEGSQRKAVKDLATVVITASSALTSTDLD